MTADNSAEIIQAQADARERKRRIADVLSALVAVGTALDVAASALVHVRDITDEEWKQDAAVEMLALRRKLRALDEIL